MCLKSVKKVGRNKIFVEFLSADDANNLLEINKYVATIPTYNITIVLLLLTIAGCGSPYLQRLVYDIFHISSIVVPDGASEILKPRRLNRKTIENGKTV